MRTFHYEQDAPLADTHWWWVARRKIITHLMDRFAGQEGVEMRGTGGGEKHVKNRKNGEFWDPS